MRTRRLSDLEFAAVMCLISKMSDARRAAAKSALVDGMTDQSIANHYGWGRTAVHNSTCVVWRMHQRYLKAKSAENPRKVLTTR